MWDFVSFDSWNIHTVVFFHISDRCKQFIIINIVTPWEFFTPELADGLLLELVSSSLRDSSQYSGRSEKCCSLSSFYLFSDV